MAWIESHQALSTHPKVLDLSARMNWTLDETLGKLHRFWWWCVDYAPDGNLRRYNDTILAGSVGLAPDRAESFVQAMVASCWIDRKPYFRVHDWWDYVGRFLQIKYKHNPVKWQEVQYSYQNPPLNGSKHSPRNRSKTQDRPTDLLPTDRPLTDRPTDLLPAARKRAAAASKDAPKSRNTWEGYARAYRHRYGVDPVSNASINALLCKLVDKLGKDEAPQVAAFYVTHNSQWYVSKMHPVNLLVQDAEKLRTEWATGRQITNGYAAHVDRTSTTGQVFKKLLAEEEATREPIHD